MIDYKEKLSHLSSPENRIHVFLKTYPSFSGTPMSVANRRFSTYTTELLWSQRHLLEQKPAVWSENRRSAPHLTLI